MSQLKRDTQITLLSRIPVMFLSFLSVVLLTRLLGPEGNGVYTFVYASLNLLITIIGFQLDSSLTFFLSNKGFENKKVVSTVGLYFLYTVMALILILFLIIYIIPGGQTLFIPKEQPVLFFFSFLIISFLLRTGSNLIQAALRGLFRFKAFNAYLTINQLIPGIVYGTLLFLNFKGNQYSLVTYFKIILIMESFLLLPGIFILWKSGEIKFSKDTHTYRKPISQYSSKNLLGTVGHFLNKRLDVWFVEFYKGMSTLGQYGLATQVTNFISDALTPFNQVLLPYLSGTPAEQHKIMVGRIARLNLYIAVTAAILIAGFSWLFIPLLFGHKFDEAIPATQILAIGIIFISMRLVFTNYFKATDQIGFTIKASWGGVIMTIVLDVLLIPRYGIMGASIASIISYATTAFFLIYHVSKRIDLQLKDIIFLKKSDITWLLSMKPEMDNTDL
ncbi:MAG TPA: polysaccharide biosynthesis C-terminal domain-containing protein [Saprospiraceae bacterium]|nr:polysaccharide biosynthesis C-terminal domain-containing protein [Saprospiraceae bacterium]